MIRALRPYPTMKASGELWMGDVPAHWNVRKMGHIGRFFKGNGGTKADNTSQGIPCVRYGDIYTTHHFHITASRTFVDPDVASTTYTPIQYGDLLYAGSGETIDEIGKSAVNLMCGPAYCGGDVIIFRPHIEINAPFLGYASDCKPAAGNKARIGRGFTVMHIYTTELKYATIPLPPLPEQAAIVRFLEYVDRRIQKYIRAKERLLALLREQRLAAMVATMRQRNVPKLRLRVVSELVKRPISQVSEDTYVPIGLYNRGRGIFKKESRLGNDLGDSDFFWVMEGDLARIFHQPTPAPFGRGG